MSDPIIKIFSNGMWNKTEDFLGNLIEKNSGISGSFVIDAVLKKYGEKGVEALKQATPRDTGKTAESWYYEIEQTENETFRLIFGNTNIVNDYANIAILIDTGHRAKNGVWVEGYHYIDPTIQPIFDEIANSIWREIIET